MPERIPPGPFRDFVLFQLSFVAAAIMTLVALTVISLTGYPQEPPSTTPNTGDESVGAASPTSPIDFLLHLVKLPITTVATPNPTNPTNQANATNPTTPVSTPVTVGRARRGSAVVRTEASDNSEVIAALFFDTQLPILDRQPPTGAAQWYKTQLWGSLEGWVRASQVDLGQEPASVRPFWEGQTADEPVSATSSDPLPLSATGRSNDQTSLRAEPGSDAALVSTIETNTDLTIDGWATDQDGHPWYRVSANGQGGWTYGGYVDLQLPPRQQSAGQPIWQPITGRGMWLPANFLDTVNSRYLVTAAGNLRLSHLYVEVAESAVGFFGADTLDAVLPPAHAAGLRVIAWVTPDLSNIPHDVALIDEVSRYRTPEGQQVDGIATDLEQNLDLDNARVFAQLMRLTVGPDRLLVATIMPAHSWFGETYPIHKVIASAFDAITPMAYWNEEERTYSETEVYDYVQQAIIQMREEVGDPNYPVAAVGQMYDTFGRNGIGQHSPTAAEISAALRAAKEANAIGISFFQWGTATPDEWSALAGSDW